MAARCDICGKGTMFGHNVSHSNRRTKRVFKANLRKHCKNTIPPEQQAFFSPEEMKLIIDECVTDKHKSIQEKRE